MLILWIRKKKGDKNNSSDKDVKQVFENHDIDMKKFRQAHPEAKIISASDILNTNGNTLVPVHKVKLAENSQN